MNSPGSPSHPKHPDDAAAQLRRLREHLQLQPDDGPAWLALARLLALRTAGPELHHALEQAIQSNPASSEAWLLAARVHQRQRGNTAALQWLAHWSRQNPGLAAPRTAAAMLQAEVARLAGRWQEALDHYRKVEKSGMPDPLLQNDIGSCLASLGQYAAAEQQFRQALREAPAFAEARINLGLVRACRGHFAEAEREVRQALRARGLDAGTRQSANALIGLLREHERLTIPLAQAIEASNLPELQRTLDRTPPALRQPHPESVATLRALADACRVTATPPVEPLEPADKGRLQLLEAFALCKLPGGAAAVRALCEKLRRPAADDPNARRFRTVLQVIRERTAHSPDVLAGKAGEAWLRYWHARLLGSSTEGHPGHYKLTTNLIDGWPTTPAGQVAGTFRVALAELLPDLPGPWECGLFLYVATSLVHGFGDGNGRLSRFLLAWETESLPHGPLIVPLEYRHKAAAALDGVRRGEGPAAVLDLLTEARQASRELLSALRDLEPQAVCSDGPDK